MRFPCLLGLVFAALTGVGGESPRGYYRFPAVHDETVLFTAEGDLWRVGIKGGVARRLTTHPGLESLAAISPDGQTIAFSAEYEGPTELYTMPLAGGLPTRRTFQGAAPRFVSWTPEGRILFSTTLYSTLPEWQLVTLDPVADASALLPLAQAGQGSYSPDGRQLVFTRFARQGSSTKRYRGGWIEHLWRFDAGGGEAVPLTADFPGTSRSPLWWNDRVCFVSDRDGVMNLWSMKPDGSDLTQLTHHREFDVKTPALSAGRIVYQCGADLWRFDLATGEDQVLDIRLASDFDQQREKWVQEPLDYLTSAHVSPKGDRVVLTARGQVFVAPVEQGRFVEVPRKPDVRYRDAAFLPDGKSLVALSDESGELEFWKLPANGVGPGEPLTTNGSVFRHAAVPSPDGKRLAWSDNDQKLWLHALETGASALVRESPRNELREFAWSPDGGWLAYVDSASNLVQQVHLYSVTNATDTVVTSDRVESYAPAWSPDGKWLYFLSDRQLRSLVDSPWGVRQPEPFFTETTKIYALALSGDQRWPFQPRDELQPEKSDQAQEQKGKAAKSDPGTDTDEPQSDEDAAPKGNNGKAGLPAVTIDLEGLGSRLFEVPLKAGNYSDLHVTAKHLLYVSHDLGFGAKSHLMQFEITNKDPKPKVLVEDIRDYEMSGDGKKLLVRKGDKFHVITAAAGAPAKLEDEVKLGGWTFPILPREEWRQIYTEAWRMLRDFFYDRGMHGVDWPAMQRKYLPLVDRVSERAELSDVLYELVGELSTLHIFVRYGDLREGPDQVALASLGARLVRDEADGGWRVEHIYRGDPDYPDQLAPLSRQTANVSEGDVITAINGRSTLQTASPDLLLRNQAGRQVLLEVKPGGGGESRPVIVEPISTGREADLRYDEWELTRRERVEQLGHGRIGYVHLRAMGSANISEWARDFFPVFNRQGLIIDVRHNRGGNIDAWILEKLLRKAWFYWQPRVGEPIWNMHYAFRGHLVVICNEKTASDGEAFTEGFKRLGLGKVIGTRTWGGEIWLSARRWLVDRGMATAAELGVYGPEGEWLIEGHGVDPDIVVDNLPHATFNGSDAQLDAAIQHLLEAIEDEPDPVPPPPDYPDKSLVR